MTPANKRLQIDAAAASRLSPGVIRKKMKTNQKINILLQDFDLVNPEFGKIVRILRKTVLSNAPNSEEKVMYGGIIFTIPGRMFCGLFLRKKYVSVEFDLGYLLKDTEKHLEGSGQYRRHLKIFDKTDIKFKKTESFILQSFKL